jgi:hypothetical protein
MFLEACAVGTSRHVGWDERGAGRTTTRARSSSERPARSSSLWIAELESFGRRHPLESLNARKARHNVSHGWE